MLKAISSHKPSTWRTQPEPDILLLCTPQPQEVAWVEEHSRMDTRQPQPASNSFSTGIKTSRSLLSRRPISISGANQWYYTPGRYLGSILSKLFSKYSIMYEQWNSVWRTCSLHFKIYRVFFSSDILPKFLFIISFLCSIEFLDNVDIWQQKVVNIISENRIFCPRK